jgi:hypothetical protein
VVVKNTLVADSQLPGREDKIAKDKVNFNVF